MVEVSGRRLEQKQHLKFLGIFVTAAALAMFACSSDSSDSGTSSKKCIEDTQCPAGQGCFRGEGQVAYCTALCTRSSQCPDQIDCPSNKPIAGEKSCEEIGKHKTQGVCRLYGSEFDASNCTKAVVTCTKSTSGAGACYCFTAATPSELSRCGRTSDPNSRCCAYEGFPREGICLCYVTRFGCEPGMKSVASCR